MLDNSMICIPIIVVIIIVIILVVYGFSRIHGHAVLKQATRKEVLGYINEHPGVHFRGIMDGTGIKQGSLSHHLDTLEREEFIKSTKDGIYKRYYPAHMRVETSVNLNISQQKVLLAVKEHPGITMDDIASRTGIQTKSVYYNARVLRDIGLIFMEKEEGVIRCYPEVQAK